MMESSDLPQSDSNIIARKRRSILDEPRTRVVAAALAVVLVVGAGLVLTNWLSTSGGDDTEGNSPIGSETQPVLRLPGDSERRVPDPNATYERPTTVPEPGGLLLRGIYAFEPVAVFAINLATARGYTVQVRFGVGGVFRPAELEGDEDPTTACPFNQQTDAIIPYVTEMENTTESFSQTVRSRIYVDEAFGASSEHPLGLAELFSGQFQCARWAKFIQDTSRGDVEAISAASVNPVEPDTWVYARGFIIVPNYFTPEFPDGNGDLLRDLVAVTTSQTFTDDAGQSSEQSITSCMGPGAFTSDFAGQLACHMPLVLS